MKLANLFLLIFLTIQFIVKMNGHNSYTFTSLSSFDSACLWTNKTLYSNFTMNLGYLFFLILTFIVKIILINLFVNVLVNS